MRGRGRNVLPPISKQSTTASWDDVSATLARAIRDGCFTPVVGSECSTIERTQTTAWRQDIAGRFASLCVELDGDYRRYLQSLADELEVDWEGTNTTLGGDPVHDLRRELVRLGAEAARLFGDQMEDEPRVVADAARFGVTLQGNDAEDLTERLVRACHEARTCRNAAQGYLGNDVWEHLKEVTREITSSSISARLNQYLNGHRVDQTETLKELKLHVEKEPKVMLSMAQLEWLCDLLWYTFRFDAPAYPTNAELAFQVALGADKPHRRPELVAAAELHSANVSQSLRDWFHQHRPQDPPTHDRHVFYSSIACYAHYQAERYDPESTSGYEPIVYSATFDLELETALAQGGRFHIVVPVEATKEEDDISDTSILWLCGTVQRPEEITHPNWHGVFLPLEEMHPFGRLPGFPQELRAPIIVKLNGSPLVELPSPKSSDCPSTLRPYREIDHAVTLAEWDYLTKVVLLDSIPDFLKRPFSRRTCLCFIGLPVNEWNTRLRMHDAVLAKVGGHLDRSVYAINEEFDPVLSHVLGHLSIQRVKVGLRKVGELIRQECGPVGVGAT